MDGHDFTCIGTRRIETSLLKSYPLGIKELSPLLKTIKAAKVDAVLEMSYPPDTFLITEQSNVIGLNSKVFFLTVGVAFPSYRDKFGEAAVEGVMGTGAWNPNVKYHGAREYFDRHVKRWGKEPDRLASAFCYAGLHIMQQAIGKVGSLDRKKTRDYIATERFPTVTGPVNFVDQFNIQSPGEISQ